LIGGFVPRTRKIETFILTNPRDCDELEKLVNDPENVVENSSDFCATLKGGKDDPGEFVITRVVEYSVKAHDNTEEATYVPPIG
jgi:hypothetical protein